MILQAAFYLAKYGNWIDFMIDDLTGKAGSSHMELINPVTNEMYSSSPRDGGVRIKPNVRDEEKWTVVPMPWLLNPANIWEWCKRRAAQSPRIGYDFAGVTHYVLPWVRGSSNSDFCSETILLACQSEGNFGGIRAEDYDPNRAMRLIGLRYANWRLDNPNV